MKLVTLEQYNEFIMGEGFIRKVDSESNSHFCISHYDKEGNVVARVILAKSPPCTNTFRVSTEVPAFQKVKDLVLREFMSTAN